MLLWLAPILVTVAAGEKAYTKTAYTYKTAGALAIQADVYRAPGRGVRPAILWIHGGALIMGDRGGIRTVQLQRYLNAGFVVVSIDYRLAPETKLPAILDDVADAYRWMREKGPALFQIDPDRIAVIGHSAGGYLTLTSGYRFRPRPRALVSFYGYGDIAGDWYSRPDPFYSRQPAVSRAQAYASVGGTAIANDEGAPQRDSFYLYTRQQGLWPDLVAGIDPRKNPTAFDAFCPLRKVTRDYPPTMLLHGDKDTDVPFAQSVLMEKELKRNGVATEFLTIPGGEHGFDRNMDDPRVADAFNRVIAFLQKHLH
ncbi:MAG: alpha/beta hydrolase [Acidobacteriota bacterium]